jgi:hypothetical protein
VPYQPTRDVLVAPACLPLPRASGTYRDNYSRKTDTVREYLRLLWIAMRRSLIALWQSNLVQGFLLAGLLCVMPIQQLRSFTAVADPDIWWHMRVGRWILEHHSFPHNGLFSSTGATHTWAAYSWGFEVIVALLNMLLGLKGLAIFVILFQVTLVLVFFLAMRILSGGFWWAWLLSAVAIWAMDLNRVDVGRPVAFSILFFTIEIALILWAQEIGRVKYLYWLPLLFLVWANFHIQFVYGLLLPALLGAVATVERWVAQRWAPGKADAGDAWPFRPLTLWAIFAACLAGTLVNPYTVGLYRVIFDYTRSTFAYTVILEFQSLNFREIPHYIQLLLVAGAFFALGRRKIDAYKLALLIIASMVGFRSVRDSWFVCITAAAIIASSVRKSEAQEAHAVAPALGLSALQLGRILAGAAVVISLSALDNHFGERALFQTVHEAYPVEAVAFIQEHHFSGPLYNNFNWGGFLIGNLPDYPVAIDGRTDLYGEDSLRQAYSTLMALRWSEDQALNRANLVLLPSTVPLSRVLERSPQFRLVYSDRIAMVFVRNP